MLFMGQEIKDKKISLSEIYDLYTINNQQDILNSIPLNISDFQLIDKKI